MKKFLFVVVVFGLIVAKAEETERRYTKMIKPVGYSNIKEEVDIMPGNDSFGFFIKKQSSEKAVCRIRIKAYCDYGLGTQKEFKSTRVNFIYKKEIFYFISDNTGLLDFYFHCHPSIENDKITLKLSKFNQTYNLSSFPKEILVPSDQCK